MKPLELPQKVSHTAWSQQTTRMKQEGPLDQVFETAPGYIARTQLKTSPTEKATFVV
jgi:hypothetical protein